MDDAPPPHWWQWPTILSLDAPIIVSLWQWLLAKSAGTRLSWPHVAVLAASVWLAYAADRWIEGWRLDPRAIRTQRHRFYQRCRWLMATLWVFVLVADLAVSFLRLNGRELTAGVLLLGPVLAYLLSHQLIHRDRRWRAPKEICIAVLLGGGAGVFIVAQPDVAWRAVAAPLAVFILLCLANVALIAAWEDEIDAAHGQTSLARQFRRGAAFGRVLPLLIGWGALVGAAFETGLPRSAMLCAAGTAVLFSIIDRAEPDLGWQLARVLVDAAMLTPFIPLATASLR